MYIYSVVSVLKLNYVYFEINILYFTIFVIAQVYEGVADELREIRIVHFHFLVIQLHDLIFHLNRKFMFFSCCFCRKLMTK